MVCPLIEMGNNYELKIVQIYTDGICLGNTGAGGYAAILEYKDVQREISGGSEKSTCARMKLTAVIRGLSALKVKCQVRILSDFELLKKATINGSGKQWNESDLPDKTFKEDKDLWENLLTLNSKHIVDYLIINSNNYNMKCLRCRNKAIEAANKTLYSLNNRNQMKKIPKLTSKKRIKGVGVSSQKCPICGGSGYRMTTAGPRSHKDTIKIMCSQCIGTGILRKQEV
jgi:ribonuclease HI